MIEWLFTLTVLELFLGGGGRLIEIGPVTLRMLLFAACVCASALIAWTTRRRDHGLLLALALVASYALVHLQPFVNGFVRGAQPQDIFADLQGSLYWLMAPFFALVLHDERLIDRSVSLVKLAGATMASIYLLVILALLTGYLNFLDLYDMLDKHGEFLFRGGNFFFFKGFLFLGVTALFLIATRGPYHGVLLVVVLTALVLSLTRGFVLATSVAALLMLVALRRWRALLLALAVVALAAFLVWVYLPSLNDWLADARSNTIRTDDMRFMFDRASLRTLLVGEGFGSYINTRLTIENSFLVILWKAGLAGLVFWMTPLLLCFGYFRRISTGDDRHRLACAMFFSVVLIYVQTATNPYLNNPIGLSFVLIALFSLRTMALSGLSASASVPSWRVDSPVGAAS